MKYTNNDEGVPQFNIMGEFKSEYMPDINSIIWMLNNDTYLPYKVVRFDYIQGTPTDIMVIVVKDAEPIDIV